MLSGGSLWGIVAGILTLTVFLACKALLSLISTVGWSSGDILAIQTILPAILTLGILFLTSHRIFHRAVGE